MNPEIIARAGWGAQPPTSTTALEGDSEGWIIHWLGDPMTVAGDAQILRSVQRYHMEHNGWSDIGYNFAVGQDGRLYELRGWDVAGAHAGTRRINRRSHGLLFIIAKGQQPSPAARASAEALIATRPGRVRPHGEVRPGGTECPGPDLIRFAAVNDRYRNEPKENPVNQIELDPQQVAELQQLLNDHGNAGLAVDGVFGPLTLSAAVGYVHQAKNLIAGQVLTIAEQRDTIGRGIDYATRLEATIAQLEADLEACRAAAPPGLTGDQERLIGVGAAFETLAATLRQVDQLAGDGPCVLRSVHERRPVLARPAGSDG